MNEMKNGKFSLGSLYITPGASQSIPHDEVLKAISRHLKGDWGDLTPDDAAENEFAVGKHLRILSAYRSLEGVKFWVITEADRSATTVLLPDEY